MRLTVSSLLAAALSVGVAQAADLPMVTKAPAKIVAATWTGVYIGAYGGYGWANTGVFNVTGGTDDGSHVADGGLAGGTLGANYQTGMWVFGVEVDGGWADLKGSNLSPSRVATSMQSKIDTLATVTGRLGITSWDRTLFYVKGGGAWASSSLDLVSTATGTITQSGNNDRWGWVVGAGVEHMFAPNWSAKVEYNYIDFGDNSLAVAFPAGGATLERMRQEVQVVKIGINYRFASSPWPWR